MAFQSNAFQSNAFQTVEVAVSALSGGIGHGGKKKKRVVIGEQLFIVDDNELRDLLSALVRDEPEKKITRKVKKTLPQVVKLFPDFANIYANFLQDIEARKMLERMAYERMLMDEDEEILLLIH
jgi:hypothetical protein